MTWYPYILLGHLSSPHVLPSMLSTLTDPSRALAPALCILFEFLYFDFFIFVFVYVFFPCYPHYLLPRLRNKTKENSTDLIIKNGSLSPSIWSLCLGLVQTLIGWPGDHSSQLGCKIILCRDHLCFSWQGGALIYQIYDVIYHMKRYTALVLLLRQLAANFQCSHKLEKELFFLFN